ncbi:hypothetical protein CRG98_015859 [Punica granatum]|nr:hypothetical protein CRG98_015859 [Punica granatum]
MAELELPGFRFHPTEQELLGFYLKNMVTGKRECFDVIGFLNIYRHDPWELPELARNGEREWYFFVPRDKKLGSGGRPNRTTERGFWKATGSDRKIFSTPDHKRPIIGLRKTLVFYKGRAPMGRKTDWVMNEYRLPDDSPLPKDMVLCKIYRKATSLKVLEQRASMEEGLIKPGQSSPLMDVSRLVPQQEFKKELLEETKVQVAAGDDKLQYDGHRRNEVSEEFQLQGSSSSSSSSSLTSSSSLPSVQLQAPFAGEKLTELLVPKFTMDWTQDSFWAQLNSPWLQALTPNYYANMINF